MYKVKIYCADGEIDNCSNWRARMQYYGEIENFDITYDIQNILYPYEDIKYDIVIFIRPLFDYLNHIKFLKENGVKIIVDYDDVFPLTFYPEHLLQHITEAIEIMKVADLITTTNENLKTYLYHHSFNNKIKVLPNIINSNFVSPNKNYHTDKVVLGWFGNSGHYSGLKTIKDVVIKILDEYENVYFNLHYPNELIRDLFDHPKVNKIQYIYDFTTFQKSIEDIDINLSPLIEDYFNLHKSNIRVILPGYKGIPSVATNFAEYKNLGGENVVLCNNEEEWYKNIKKLIVDIEFRNIIGTNIKNFVDENLTYEVCKKEKKQMFESLVNKNITLVQLGSNKGNDELTRFIKDNDVTFSKAIFVEANPLHIEELKKCYEKYENVYIENIAVKPTKDSPDEIEIFYHKQDEPHYEVASTSIEHVAGHHGNDYENISSFRIKSTTLDELLKKYGIKKIDWLLIDVEGLDAQIVENFNWGDYDIRRVDVEHIHFGEKWNKIFEFFYSMNYKHVVANDTRYDAAFEKIKKS